MLENLILPQEQADYVLKLHQKTYAYLISIGSFTPQGGENEADEY